MTLPTDRIQAHAADPEKVNAELAALDVDIMLP